MSFDDVKILSTLAPMMTSIGCVRVRVSIALRCLVYRPQPNTFIGLRAQLRVRLYVCIARGRADVLSFFFVFVVPRLS